MKPVTENPEVIVVEPGSDIVLEDIKAQALAFGQDGGSLIITLPDGSEYVLQNFFVVGEGELPSQLTLADGVVMSAADIQEQIGEFNPAEIAPAAGAPGAGGNGGGANFVAYSDPGIGDGLGRQVRSKDVLDDAVEAAEAATGATA